MSTEYEAHLVIGCSFSEADNMGMEEEHYKEYLYNEHDIIWYAEDDFLGFRITVDQLNIGAVQRLGKIAKEVRGILGHDVTVESCLYQY